MEKTVRHALWVFYVFGCIVGFFFEFVLILKYPYFAILSSAIFIISFFVMMKTDTWIQMLFAGSFFVAGMFAATLWTLCSLVVLSFLLLLIDLPGIIGTIAEKRKAKKAAS